MTDLGLKNNSTDEYDGDIGLLIDYDGETVDEVCNSFVIPAKTNSKIIQLSFTPTNSGTYTVIVYRPSESPGYLRYIYYTYGDTYQTQVNVKVASGSNSLDLSIQGISLSSPFDNGSPISLYGTTLKGSFRIANENTENYVGEVGWQLVNSSDNVISESFKEKAIAAGESLTIPFDVTGLTIGNEYRLYTLYTKNNSWNGSYIRFQTQPAIMSYAADGTISASKPSSTSYDAATNAPNAFAIDVTGTNVTSITPNGQPNTVYIYSGTKPNGLDGKNVIKYNDGEYTAENITLTDGNAFVLNENSGSAPFRAYFKPGIYDRSVNSLTIGSKPADGTTGIEDVNLNDNVNDNDNGNFFNLNGQRVTHPTKGLYISNGKKVIIK